MSVKVIIIGGGPVGLSAAIALARQGIASILIEKHATTTQHPKARGVNARSMELFRLWDLEDRLKQHQMPREAYGFTWIEDFQGKELSRIQTTTDYSLYSPTENAIIAQDDLEQELFNKAKNLSLIDLRFNMEMKHAIQNDDQVIVDILDKANNKMVKICADYVIAADGAHSFLRTLFNVEMEGIDNLGTFCNIYCEMNIDKYVAHRPSAAFMFTREDIRGTCILSKKDHKKWLIGLRIDASSQESFTDAFCVDYIKKVINDKDIAIQIINKSFWTMAALTAKNYQIGRVFFAGDAAHCLPPTGGFGMNTGIQDVHNLAWKLAMVLKHQADQSLLKTYFTERVQIAKTNIAWSLDNAKRFETIFTALVKNDLTTFKQALHDQTHHINNILLDLGFVYGFDYQYEKVYKPSARVGGRAPHCWLLKDHKKISILSLYEKQFVLVSHPNARYWQKQFKTFPCRIVTIGEIGEYLDKNHDFLEHYGISNEGAVLVRPDGHVAWRAHGKKEKMAYFSWLR